MSRFLRIELPHRADLDAYALDVGTVGAARGDAGVLFYFHLEDGSRFVVPAPTDAAEAFADQIRAAAKNAREHSR